MPDSQAPFHVTTGPLPASRRIYLEGEQPGVRVPMRAIDLHPSAGEEPVVVYDTSGPYTDPDENIDIEAGAPRIRKPWIEARGDVELYDGRDVKPEDNGNVSERHLAREFPVRNTPLRAKPGRRPTQPPSRANSSLASSVTCPSRVTRSR